jgi:hypothetical protein
MDRIWEVESHPHSHQIVLCVRNTGMTLVRSSLVLSLVRIGTTSHQSVVDTKQRVAVLLFAHSGSI